MIIKIIDPAKFERLHVDQEIFIQSLDNTAYIVRGLFNAQFVDKIVNFCLDFSSLSEPSWHPCTDGCPDYHRIHDKYPNAYVKSTQHAYYFHTWNKNKSLFDDFKFIFSLKASLAGTQESCETYLSNIPTAGPIARVVVHQYPIGGGGQEEHIDPVSPFARVQTIIQASNPNIDYKEGGLYITHDKFGKINIDALTMKGDLILMSPGCKHGVAAIDPSESLNWNSSNGRWIIMPIIINSDVSKDNYGKPVGLGKYE